MRFKQIFILTLFMLLSTFAVAQKEYYKVYLKNAINILSGDIYLGTPCYLPKNDSSYLLIKDHEFN